MSNIPDMNDEEMRDYAKRYNKEVGKMNETNNERKEPRTEKEISSIATDRAKTGLEHDRKNAKMETKPEKTAGEKAKERMKKSREREKNRGIER